MFGTDSNPPVGHKLREFTLIRFCDKCGLSVTHLPDPEGSRNQIQTGRRAQIASGTQSACHVRRLTRRGRPPFRPRLDQVATPVPPTRSVIKSPDFPLARQHYAPRMVVIKGLSPEMTGACRSPRKRERSERNASNVNRLVHDSMLKPGHT